MVMLTKARYANFCELMHRVGGDILAGEGRNEIMKALLWELARSKGVLVEGQGERDGKGGYETVSGNWKQMRWWEKVQQLCEERGIDGTPVMELGTVVVGWAEQDDKEDRYRPPNTECTHRDDVRSTTLPCRAGGVFGLDCWTPWAMVRPTSSLKEP